MEFVRKQKKLKMMIVHASLHLQQLRLIIEELSELEVIKIFWSFGYDEWAEIMATKTGLKKIRFA